MVKVGGRRVSRIGKLPVVIPNGVEVKIEGRTIDINGQKGSMNFVFSPHVEVKQVENEIIVTRRSEEKIARALHGTTRSLIQNMVSGVSDGFVKILQIDGVGYRAEMNGNNVVINVGYSHPVIVEPPEGITFNVDEKTRQISVSGYDKQVVGQVAADIRKIRPAEPYKGKGIRYLGERIRRKPGKSAKVGAS